MYIFFCRECSDFGVGGWVSTNPNVVRICKSVRIIGCSLSWSHNIQMLLEWIHIRMYHFWHVGGKKKTLECQFFLPRRAHLQLIRGIVDQRIWWVSPNIIWKVHFKAIPHYLHGNSSFDDFCDVSDMDCQISYALVVQRPPSFFFIKPHWE